MDRLVREYYGLVKRYCAFVEGLVISRDRIEELMSILLQLYEKAFHLPDLDVNNVSVKRLDKVLPLKMDIPDHYWLAFDPFDGDDEANLVCSPIFDDLNDIYRDLMEGVTKYDMGEIGDAVFDWKEGAKGHWGDHAVSLIKALHWLRTTH